MTLAPGVLVATTPCLAEGMNIPEAGVVVFLDHDWVPSVMAQAFSRVLRTQQERDGLPSSSSRRAPAGGATRRRRRVAVIPGAGAPHAVHLL